MISAKIMILGAVGVGKSSVVQRFVRDRFDADYKSTIGVEIQTCDISIESPEGPQIVRLMLWDTDGDFGQRIFDMAYVKGASGAIAVADASRPATLRKVNDLIASFEAQFPGRPVRAVVNKCDLARIDADELKGFGVRSDLVALTSAKTGEGVRELFDSLASDIWRRKPVS